MENIVNAINGVKLFYYIKSNCLLFPKLQLNMLHVWETYKT